MKNASLWINRSFLTLLLLLAGSMAVLVGNRYATSPQDAPLVADSTLAELALWMSEEAQDANPPSLLGSWAQTWQTQNATALPTDLVAGFQANTFLWTVVIAVCLGVGALGVLTGGRWTRGILLVGLLGLDSLLFVFPSVPEANQIPLLLGAIVCLLAVMLFAHGKTTRVIGFFVTFSALLVTWEVAKIGAEAIGFAVRVPQPAWTNTRTYPTLEEALQALQAGEVSAVFADENDVEDVVPVTGSETGDPAYSDLRFVDLQAQEGLLFFPIEPELPGRLTTVFRAEDATRYQRPSQLLGEAVGAITGDFAEEKYLALPREMVLVEFNIFNDINLPHLQQIAEAFLQPARRNGEFLLVRILGQAGFYTWSEAILGFSFGVVLGLFLGTLFASYRLLERALLPYVVASQTVPILAIAPMVIIWLGASLTSVAVIAAYITFFPVAINTLRGLQSPNPTAVELMQSYAATEWQILMKLRFPAALPYIFTALKVSATSSVVGAIIGELPSGISEGLARAILDFGSDYSAVSTPKLWAAIVMAAFVGIIFFVGVSVCEYFVLRRYVRSASS